MPNFQSCRSMELESLRIRASLLDRVYWTLRVKGDPDDEVVGVSVECTNSENAEFLLDTDAQFFLTRTDKKIDSTPDLNPIHDLYLH